MNIIRSLSILILFFGLIILTVYITRSYTLHENTKKEVIQKASLYDLYMKKRSERPTAVLGKMFTDSSVWMGYTDPDVKNMPKNLNSYDVFNSDKFSLISDKSE